MLNFVVIDLGSNSVRMKISQIGPYGDFKVVGYQKKFVRLSENMGKEKTLKKEPIERTMKALKEFKATYSKLKNVKIRAVATAAVRQAKNQKYFLNRVKKELGINLRVISGAAEAYLDYLGVVNTLPVKNGLIMDTGGASTELIWVQNGNCEKRISLPTGSVLLSQNYNLTDQIKASDLYKAMTAAELRLSAVPWINNAHNMPLIALGGSNRTIAKIKRREVTDNINDLPDIHGMHLPADNIYALFEKLVSLDKIGRTKIPGLAKIRGDVIVGGLIPISLVLRMLQIDEVIFSNHGIRDGLLYEYLQNKDAENVK
ncbi:Ppx/GppA family phosphatase [Lactobacillus acetotolerans]|jgi:exopolyphosphatase/guanosine-5'-triphosphate,3'-diphosphate pyrophosphatase|uniref:Ppx/GppA family phosphatase n=1 Tax=Lactobacillus acetotolerans TaxID=1600 RepID=UPI0007BA0A8D|nr:Ppx/GppA family phosphatase [Lactobacillus acetotolerans]MBN7276917.1 exopolyphosphatase [Lactobacillus acetotolerans]QGV04261.1 exopolyphosphatase [Lactobacillus acetotolerans]HBG91091.1 Ppx/GppA family phosphatase [Lactobacillus acetotolerans]HCX40160.1 Ppx/GppA family phosphatase [Lactobacillus acetotolerans]